MPIVKEEVLSALKTHIRSLRERIVSNTAILKRLNRSSMQIKISQMPPPLREPMDLFYNQQSSLPRSIQERISQIPF